MPLFLVNWIRPGMRTLHRDHLVREFQNDDRFDTVEFRLAEPREFGSYRVIASTKTQWVLDDHTYPSTEARIEIGFANPNQNSDYRYWFNWIEPERSFMLGWHRDGDHSALGPTHVQINQGGSVIDRKAAEPIESHPGAIFHGRLDQLPSMLKRIPWDGDQAIGFTEASEHHSYSNN